MVLYIISSSLKRITLIILSVFIFTIAAAEPLPQLPAIHSIPDSVISALQKKKEFAYANDPAYWEKENSKQGMSWLERIYLFATQQWLKTFICLLFAAALLYVLYRIIITKRFFLFYSSKKMHVSVEEQKETAENLEEKIALAARAGDYRSAVRFMYLKALRLLDAKGWIDFNAKSTNRDYLNALHPYPLAQTFSMITRSYNYVWYGEFALNEQQFMTLQKSFNQFYNSVPIADTIKNRQAN